MSKLYKTYQKELSLFYGDKNKLFENLKNRIIKYSASPRTPKVNERLLYLKQLLAEAKKQEI